MWFRPDGIAHIDVYVKAKGDARQCPTEREANPAVLIIASDGLRGRTFGIEDKAVIDLNGGDLADQAEHVLGAIFESVRGQVYVARRPTGVQRGKHDAAFQHESICVRRALRSIEC